jgi:hypothetical protein
MRGRAERQVVRADQGPSPPVPVVEAVVAGQGQQVRPPIELRLDPGQPLERGAAIRVDVDEQLALGRAAAPLTRHDEALARLVDHAHAGNVSGHGMGAVRARVVHHENLVGEPGLGQQRMQTPGEDALLVVCAHDHADAQRHRFVARSICRPRNDRLSRE